MRTIDRDVSARPHRDADMGSGQSRRIVDAVARHGNHLAFFLQAFYQRELALRRDLAQHLVNAELAGDRARRAQAVASGHDDRQPGPSQRCERGRRRRLDRVRDGNQADQLALGCKEHHAGAAAPQRLRLRV